MGPWVPEHSGAGAQSPVTASGQEYTDPHCMVRDWSTGTKLQEERAEKKKNKGGGLVSRYKWPDSLVMTEQMLSPDRVVNWVHGTGPWLQICPSLTWPFSKPRNCPQHNVNPMWVRQTTHGDHADPTFGLWFLGLFLSRAELSTRNS